MAILLPNTIPEHDQEGLLKLQEALLELAEQLLGDRDKSKIIYQPDFDVNGPYINNTPNLDGASARLSPNSKLYWPTVVYEMAHEIIHLLNPIVGYTNWLEEGIAVKFSIFAQNEPNLHPIQQPISGPYFDALELVNTLIQLQVRVF